MQKYKAFLLLLISGFIFSSFNTQPTYTIAFLGDSHIQMGDWKILLNRNDVFVYAVNTDATGNIQKYTPVIFQYKPEICFIMGGINDIAANYPVEKTFENLRSICFQLKSRDIIPVISSTLYVSEEEYKLYKWNSKVYELNRMLKQFCEAEEFDFIDLNEFLSADKSLEKKYSQDGIHLNEAGYKFWTEQINLVLKKYSL